MEVLTVWLFFPCIAALIGHRKGRLVEGVAAGLLLGPIGCLWIFLVDKKPTCKECGGFVVKGARKCLHCGSSLTNSASLHRDPRIDPLYNQKTNTAVETDLDSEIADLLTASPSKSKTRLQK